MKKSVFIALPLFLLNLVFFPQSSARADVPGPPKLPGPGDVIDWDNSGPGVSRPSAFQREFFEGLEVFDQAYAQLQAEQQSKAERWEDLANRVFLPYTTMAPDGEDGPFIMRGRLIHAECLLFAAVGRMRRDQRSEALSHYRKGVHLLRKIVLLHRTYRDLGYPDLKELPHYRKQQVVVRGREEKALHPFAGYETIGTGLVPGGAYASSGGQEVRSYVSGSVLYGPYRTIDVLQAEIESDYSAIHHVRNQRTTQTLAAPRDLSSLEQKSTDLTAMDLLADFCPWGVDLYLLMEEAGLTDDLDYRILRPFAGYDPGFAEELAVGLSQLPAWVLGRPVGPREKSPPPVIGEVVLEPYQVPKHIRDEMGVIIGDGQEGFLDAARQKPIKWAWVEDEPTCTAWFFSPTVFDWQPSDYLRMWFTTVKLYFNPAGTVVDEVIAGLHNAIGAIYGTDSDIHFVAKVFVEANDKGFYTTDSIKEGKWLSSAGATRKLAGYGFQAAEANLREGLYGHRGLDPRKLSVGKTYNGQPVPPIVIRADVCGYEKLPDDHYPRAVQAIRFYLLFPENIANVGPEQGYDLGPESAVGIRPLHRAKQYLEEQRRAESGGGPEPVRKLAWESLPAPLAELAALTVVTDFSPKRQILEFKLNAEAREIISKREDHVYAELWAENEGGATRYARARLARGFPGFRFNLYSRNNPAGKAEFDQLVKTLTDADEEAFGVSLDAPSWGTEDSTHVERAPVPASWGQKAPTILAVVRNHYQLKLTSEDQNVSKNYDVNLDRGRKSQREITGRVSQPQSGILALDYSPDLEILELRVRKGEGVIPGNASGAANSGR